MLLDVHLAAVQHSGLKSLYVDLMKSSLLSERRSTLV